MRIEKVNQEQYHIVLNKLPKSLRAYIDKYVRADNYYLAYDKDKTIGGFGTNKNGYLTGLFSLYKGYGKKLFKYRLVQMKKDIDRSVTSLTIFCTGNKLRELYESFNFKVINTITWDDAYATENWDYKRFGRPNLYEMELKLKETKKK